MRNVTVTCDSCHCNIDNSAVPAYSTTNRAGAQVVITKHPLARHKDAPAYKDLCDVCLWRLGIELPR